MSTLAEPSDLEAQHAECAQEPIHIPSSIQPHGMLLALTAADLRLAAVSENLAALLHTTPQQLAGQTIDRILDKSSSERLGQELRSDRPASAVVRLLPPAPPDAWEASVHRSGDLILAEFEPSQAGDDGKFLFDQVRTGTDTIRRAATVAEACQSLVRSIRVMSGYDRVMVYRFDARWNGEVIAEDATAGGRSYLGHNFPASDIPAQARALYTSNTFRLIPDARYAPSRILPAANSADGQPIDLSSSILRSVSPIHCEYLANMGVVASMSVSIIKDGALWGLVACHHHAPRFVSLAVRQACELLTQALSWFLDTNERIAFARAVEAVRETASTAGPTAGGDSRSALDRVLAALLQQAGADGMALCHATDIWTAGVTPDRARIRAIADRLGADQEQALFTDRLGELHPSADGEQSAASGMAAVRLPMSWLLWFRPEWPHTVSWAGDPAAPVIVSPETGRINPRTSFRTWRQHVRGHSRPWDTHDQAMVIEAGNLVTRLLFEDQEARRQEAAERERERTATELKAATALQTSLLPSLRVQHDIMAASGLDIAGRCVSCSEIGGDLWGLSLLPDGRVGVYIVDFAGHGTAAALNTFRLHTLFSELTALLAEPARLLAALNVRLTGLLPAGMFATMFYAVVDAGSNSLTYAAAGAPPPILRGSQDGPLTPLDSSGLPLGISAGAEYICRAAPFDPGAMIVLYSDMLTDAVDPNGGRVADGSALALVQGCATAPSANAIVAGICAPFLDQSEIPLTDDLTVICIRRP